MVRSGARTRASCTASAATSSRSTGSCSSGRCWSSRASSSRSSTSRPIRAASSSTRRITRSRLSGSGDRALAVELGEAADRGQRGPQLVAGVGDEPAHPLLGRARRLLGGLAGAERRLDLAEHRVEAPGTAGRPRCAGRSPGTRWVRSPAAISAAVVSTSLQRPQRGADDDVGQPAEQRQDDGADEQLERDQPVQRCPSTSSSEIARTAQHRAAVRSVGRLDDHDPPLAAARPAGDRERADARAASDLRPADGRAAMRRLGLDWSAKTGTPASVVTAQPLGPAVSERRVARRPAAAPACSDGGICRRPGPGRPGRQVAAQLGGDDDAGRRPAPTADSSDAGRRPA